MSEARIDSLRKKHSKLNQEIDDIERRELVDQQYIKKLKKQRLALKDEIKLLTLKQGASNGSSRTRNS